MKKPNLIVVGLVIFAISCIIAKYCLWVGVLIGVFLMVVDKRPEEKNDRDNV